MSSPNPRINLSHKTSFLSSDGEFIDIVDMKCAFPAARNTDTSLPTRWAEIALIELYIGCHAYAPLKARSAYIYKQCWTKRCVYRCALIHNSEAGAAACILVSSCTNIKHLLACLQILDNTIIGDTFIYHDIAMIVYCKRTEMTNGGSWLFNPANLST